MPVRVVPAVVGALGTAPKKLKQWLSDIEIGAIIVELYKTTVLYSARIL